MNILFTCIYMDCFHGSVRHVCEYGEYLSQKGHKVYISTLYSSTKVRKYAKDLGLYIYDIDETPLNINYDIIWAYHQFLFPYLIMKGLKYSKCIGCTLSPFVEIEKIPPIYKYFNLLTCVSEEVKHMYQKKFNINNYFEIIPNHIPTSFIQQQKKLSKDLNKICIISNHPPKELLKLHNTKNYIVDIYGFKTNTNINITPSVLKNYDVIITIGKTIQYGLALGIPVYEYDIFGGCGYITKDNIFTEEKTNFSGRGSNRRLETNEILNEIKEYYTNACSDISILRDIALKRYSIEMLIERQINIVQSRANIVIPNNSEFLLYLNSCSSCIQYLKQFHTMYLVSDKKYEQIIKSKAWRLITIIKNIKNFFNSNANIFNKINNEN